MSADIVDRLNAWAETQVQPTGAQLARDAAAHIQSLRRTVRAQRAEIAQHISVRNALLDMDKPPGYGNISLEAK